MNYVAVQTGKRISFLIRKPVTFGLPYAVTLEPTNYCNLRCAECPSGLQTDNRTKGFLAIDDYRNIIATNASQLIYLMLYFQGEPLLHEYFISMIKVAKKHRLFVFTSTNGHHLDENKCEELVKSGLDHIIISVDGASQKTYESYRKGGNLDRVKKNLCTLVKKKKDLGSTTPFVTVQFLVTSKNEHEMEEMKTWKKSMGFDELSFKSMQIYDLEKGKKLLPGNEKYRRYRTSYNNHLVLKKKVNHCARLWQTVVITHSGNILPCCYDKSELHVMDSLKNSELKNIWYSEKFKHFRQQVLRGNGTVEMCNNCIG